MKNKVLCLFLLASFTIKAGIYENTVKYIVDSPGTPIYQSDIGDGAVGYCISSPGKYYLDENITGDAGNTIAIIQINSSDVYLDLNDRVLSCSNCTPTNGIINFPGVGGFKNIGICNGIINGENKLVRGIQFDPPATNYNESILIENLQINSCLGIEIRKMKNSLINNCILCILSDILPSPAIYYITCHAVKTNNVLINASGTTTGFQIEGGTGSSGLVFENCSVVADDAKGFSLWGDNHSLLDCNVTNSSSSPSYRINGHNMSLSQCKCTNSSGFGFHIFTGQSNNILDYCIAFGCNGTGFYIDGVQNTINNCIANDNGRGFHFAGPCAISNCVAIHNLDWGFLSSGNDGSITHCAAIANNNGFQEAGTNGWAWNSASGNTSNYSALPAGSTSLIHTTSYEGINLEE